MKRLINILWLDDDLRPKADGITEERCRLQPWLRWFATKDRPQKFSLIEAQTIEKFSYELKQRAFLKPEDNDYVDALLIDTMWKRNSKSASSFAAIGLPNEAIIPLEAGAQLIGFMRSKKPSIPRHDWLEPYSKRHTAVLTTLTDSNGSLHDHVGDTELSTLTVIQKKVRNGTDGISDLLEPDANWLAWIEKTQRSIEQLYSKPKEK